MRNRPVAPLFLCAIAAALGVAGAAESPAAGASAQDPDFLFGRPRGSLGARGAWFNAAAGSDIYDFFIENLTIEKSDFDSPLLGIDAGIAVHPRVDVIMTFELSRASTTSDYRDFVDENDLPIVQQTKLTSVPILGGVKLYVLPRGREVSRYAYVASRVRPYVGAAGGFLWYELEQIGDFVDFVDLTIFTSAFQSSGFSLAAQGFGGVEIALTPRWFVAIDGRYLWADSELSQDFVGFEPIDLSGARIGAGIYFQF